MPAYWNFRSYKRKFELVTTLLGPEESNGFRKGYSQLKRHGCSFASLNNEQAVPHGNVCKMKPQIKTRFLLNQIFKINVTGKGVCIELALGLNTARQKRLRIRRGQFTLERMRSEFDVSIWRRNFAQSWTEMCSTSTNWRRVYLKFIWCIHF